MSVHLAPISSVAAFNPSPPKGSLAIDDEIAFVPMAAVSEDGSMHVSEHKRSATLSNGYSYFQNGDVLVAKITPCYENNKITVARIDREHGFGSTEFHVIRPTASNLDARDLAYFLRQDSVRELGQKRMTGSAGQRRVPRQFLEQLEIPLPSLDEQRRIVGILDQADSLRDKRRAALDQSGKLTKAFFVQLFGDPVKNDFSWDKDKLGNVGELERGVSKHRPRNDPMLLGGAYPLIQTGDVANADGYIRAYSSTYSDAGLKQSRIWPKGTLCITIAANIGKTAILTFDACFPDSVVGFSPSKRVTTEYIQHWLGFVQERLEEQAPQSAQKNINLAILRNLDIPVPPLQLQTRFQTFVNQFVAERTVLTAQLTRIDALFASLQYRAFRGEL
jgi:type I restriction enzyme S subunit